MITTYYYLPETPQGAPQTPDQSHQLNLKADLLAGASLHAKVELFDANLALSTDHHYVGLATNLDEAQQLIQHLDTYLVVPGLFSEVPEHYQPLLDQTHPNKLGLIAFSPSQAQALKKFSKGLDILLIPLIDPDLLPIITPGSPPNNPISLCKQADFDCKIIDSYGFDIDSNAYQITGSGGLDPEFGPTRIPWDGTPLLFEFGQNDYNGGLLSGFYPSENWGAWSMKSAVSISLPYWIKGPFSLSILAMAYGANINRSITVSFGQQQTTLTLEKGPTEYHINFDAASAEHKIHFDNLSLAIPEDAGDTRTMGIGLCKISISQQEQLPSSPDVLTGHLAPISEIRYVSFLPRDISAGGWRDLITAFTYTFRHHKNVSLIVVLPETYTLKNTMDISLALSRCMPFDCRVLLFCGPLSAKDKQQLLSCVTFYVNVNYLQEYPGIDLVFKVRGTPTIAPKHAVFYSDLKPSSNLFYSTTNEPFRTSINDSPKLHLMKNRIDWQSLCRILDESLRCLGNEKRIQQLSQVEDHINKYFSKKNIYKPFKFFAR